MRSLQTAPQPPGRPPRTHPRPGQDYRGCVVVGHTTLLLRCPCQATFRPTRWQLVRDYDLVCPGCRKKPKLTVGTASYTLLKAAYYLPETFTLVELTLAAWRLDRGRFGLAGHAEHYPSDNRVKVEVCQGRSRRWKTFGRFVKRVGPNTYQLNPEGVAKAVELFGQKGTA